MVGGASVLAVARIAVLRCAAGHVRRERAAQRTDGEQKQDQAEPSRAWNPLHSAQLGRRLVKVAAADVGCAKSLFSPSWCRTANCVTTRGRVSEGGGPSPDASPLKGRASVTTHAPERGEVWLPDDGT